MSETDRGVMVRFACPNCARPMQARAEYAGRKTRCPGCQHQLAIPGPNAEAAAPAARPPAGKASLLVGAGLAVLLLALGGAFAAWKLWPRGGGATAVQYASEDHDDFDLLPATAQALAVARVADLWQRPATQKALADRQKSDRRDLAAELEAAFGLSPGEVERLSLVLLNADESLGYGVVRTRQPYDGPKVLARLTGAAEKTHQGVSYYAGAAADGRPAAVCFAGRRVLIAGEEPGVRRAIELLRAPAKIGPLAGPIDQARSGKHHAVFAASPASGGTEELRQTPAAFLADIKTATGTLDVAAKAVYDVRLEMPDEARAKQVSAEIAKARKLVPFMLLALPLEPEQSKGVLKLLTALKVNQKGAEVTLRGEADEETAVALLVLALSQGRPAQP